ncbi:hypothetical protein [Calothrix sp. CCY 0018]|uniref:hypothetical protein n=1 Tax=Calothrix sp. CCY 0018 TaxID=3103864 RepID=UPI0039C714DA
MEYILLGIYTLISILTGIIVGILWFIRAKKTYFKKWYLGFIYIFFSITISTLVIILFAAFVWILESSNRRFNINFFLQSLNNTIHAWGFTSGFISMIIFIIGIIGYGLIRFFEKH